MKQHSYRPLEVRFGGRFAQIVDPLDLLKEVRSTREESMRGGEDIASLRHVWVYSVALEE